MGRLARFHEPTAPESVQELDRFLNQSLALASTDAEITRQLALKQRVKRRLVAVPPDCLEREAVVILAHLSELVDEVGAIANTIGPEIAERSAELLLARVGR